MVIALLGYGLCIIHSQYFSDPQSAVCGCLEYFRSLSEADLRLLKDFNPCDIKNEGGEISFAMKINGQERNLSALMLANFYFEYTLYCVMRKDTDLYSCRLDYPKQQSSEEGVWVASVSSFLFPLNSRFQIISVHAK